VISRRIDTIQRRTLRVGARLECEAIVTPTPLPPPTNAETIALSIDSGHVRAVRSYQVRTFEVFVAQDAHWRSGAQSRVGGRASASGMEPCNQSLCGL